MLHKRLQRYGSYEEQNIEEKGGNKKENRVVFGGGWRVR